jgi:hypothetical protein
LILKEVKDFWWHELSEKTRVQLFLLGKELAEDRLKKGLHLMLLKEIQKESILSFLTEEDWLSILSGHSELNKELRVNLTEWVKFCPHHKDQLPVLLANIEYVDWYRYKCKFNNAEREELFMIGKEIGNKCLMNGMFNVLQEEVEVSTLEKFSAQDWKYLLSCDRLTKGVWKIYSHGSS